MKNLRQIVNVVPPEVRQQCPTYEDYLQWRQMYYQQPICITYIPYKMTYPLMCEQPKEETDLVNFEFFNIDGIRGYYKELDNGELIRLVNAEDIAIGAGLNKDEDKISTTCGRKSYDSIRWNRFNQYAQDSLDYLKEVVSPLVFDYIHIPINKDSYIPIELAVQIIICCRSEQAKRFQAIVSVKIANEIAKLNDIKYKKNINTMSQQLEEQTRLMNQTREYYENFNSTKHCFTITEIAKDYGLTAQTLNLVLNRIGIIFPVNNTWQLYESLASFGYTTSRNENGNVNTYWTANGRWFINIALERYGIERNKDNSEIVNKLLNK